MKVSIKVEVVEEIEIGEGENDKLEIVGVVDGTDKRVEICNDKEILVTLREKDAHNLITVLEDVLKELNRYSELLSR